MAQDAVNLPPIIKTVLERNGLVAIPREEYNRLLDPPTAPDKCPYPLHQMPMWISHDRYMGTIVGTEGDLMSGLHVVMCEACRHVRFEIPVAYA